MEAGDLLSAALDRSIVQQKGVVPHDKSVVVVGDRPGCNSFPQRLEDGEEGGGRSFFRVRHVEHPGGAGFAFVPAVGTILLLFDPGRLGQLLSLGFDG